MNKEETTKLMTALVAGRLTNEEFIREYSEGNKIDDEYCLHLFEEAFNNKDSDTVEDAIIVSVASNSFSDKFSEILCKLLQENWHFRHEDIARTLQDLEDPSTIDCLFKAAQLHFEYLAYDDTRQFARKCIKALSAINNDEAINKLGMLAQSEVPEIKGYAEKELKYKGLL